MGEHEKQLLEEEFQRTFPSSIDFNNGGTSPLRKRLHDEHTFWNSEEKELKVPSRRRSISLDSIQLQPETVRRHSALSIDAFSGENGKIPDFDQAFTFNGCGSPLTMCSLTLTDDDLENLL